MSALLKRAISEAGLSQNKFASEAGVNQTALCLAMKGTFPKKVGFKEKVAEAVSKNEKISKWLSEKNIQLADIWNEDNITSKIKKGKGLHERKPAFELGDATEIDFLQEAEMIDPKAMRHFKLFRNPFLQDISNADDIYNSEEHLFIRELMLDAGRNAGFVMIDGPVGSGKSTIRKYVAEKLTDEDIAVIFPVIIDKKRITPSSLLDAIIMDISNEKPKMRLEQKTRQALKLLKGRAASGQKQVLIIEEVHLLDIDAFKALKQISELENGYNKLCGIIGLGQSEELEDIFSNNNYQMREVTRRLMRGSIAGLSADVEEYIRHKFKRTGANADNIFDADAYEAFRRKLTQKNLRGKEEDQTFPLLINNLAAKAINMAARIGEEKVTADIILKISAT